MLLSLRRHFAQSVLVLTICQPVTPCVAADLPIRLARVFPKKVDDVGKKPKTCKDGCVEELAKNIDWLEHNLNMNGTVVAKTPDVWGEARLTAHRQEFENTLKQELGAFNKSSIQGAEFVSDQSMLAFAMALNARTVASPMALPTVTQSMSAANTTGVSVPSSGAVAAPATNQSVDFGTVVPFGSTGAITFGKDGNIQVEQTEVLDQLANYVNHLHAIRRRNEGPDSGDAPGYAMNLLRIPVSVLPGQNTKRGYGAEITITAEPYLGDELLPTSFREFVINDLIDQLALPYAQYLNFDPEAVRFVAFVIDAYNDVVREIAATSNVNELMEWQGNHPNKIAYSDAGYYFGYDIEEGQRRLNDLRLALTASKTHNPVIERLKKAVDSTTTDPASQFKIFRSISSIAREHVQNNLSHSSSSATRRVTLPFPPSQLPYNFGLENLSDILVGVYSAVQQDLINRQVVHVSDLSGILREEIGAAYELLAKPSMHYVWELENVPQESQLAELIRTRNMNGVRERRYNFENFLASKGWGELTSSLAWCLYVDSLLLNDRLNRDIVKTFGNTPKSPSATQWFAFHEPAPCPEARRAFAEYVKIRWPIKVFALDPDINEQNIQDVRSIYRQMQLAVAIGYATGNVGISGALQAMRKLQRDRATVDLNRIAIGFEHGDDTFGWRFTPRFQTPPVESNATVFFRDLIVGGPTDRQLEHSQAIEAGTRECNALIIMPSFVPHVTLHTRGNWYRIGSPTRTGDSVHDTVQYSRATKQMEYNVQKCCQCAHLYRDGEVERLLNRVKQIDNKLALQTLECQVPIENTLGGHEILTAGRRELAPELNGWYGAPGYDPSRETTLFLSGESFSVTQNRLVVGNQLVSAELLSRQVLKVVLPPGLTVMRDRKLDDAGSENFSGYVDAQLATPYGVSGHMLIPALRSTSIAAPQVTTLRPNTIQIAAQLSSNKSTDRKLFTVSNYNPVKSGIKLLQVDVPAGDGLREFLTFPAVISTSSGSDQLANIAGINLSTIDGGASFSSTENELANQFADATTTTKLGGVIANHISYLLLNSKAPPGSKITYQINAALSYDSNLTTHPLTKASGAVQIVITLIEPKQ